MAKVYIENINDFIEVDDEDYERVKYYKWHKSYTHDTHRFLTQIVGHRITLPAFIINDEYAYQKEKNYDFRKSNIKTDK